MIQVRNLRKLYDRHLALRGISFEVADGDIFGFIGPNGAGKTTTIRILSTLLEPTSGTVLIDGVNIISDPIRVRRLIGYMPDLFDVYPTLTVEEYLDFFAALYGYRHKERVRVVEQILDLTDLKPVRDKLAGALSKGMKQRLILAKTLVHDPKVLILDEPASGLDPRARIEFRALLKALRDMGKTIFISSHILTELSDVCNAVAIIEKGRIVISGKVSEIIEKLTPTKRLLIEVLEQAPQAADCARQFPECERIEVQNHTIRIEFRGGRERVAELLKHLVARGVPVVTIAEEKADLEDLFMKLTKGEVS